MRAGRRLPQLTTRLAVSLCAALVAMIGSASSVMSVPEGPSPGSPAWIAREAQNVARTSGEQQREAQDPSFQPRLQAQSAANFVAFNQRQVADPDWNSTGNICETWQWDCAGDPFLYPGVDPFYEKVGKVIPISYYDDGGARISGRVWAPRRGTGKRLPGVVMRPARCRPPRPFTGGLPRPS